MFSNKNKIKTNPENLLLRYNNFFENIYGQIIFWKNVFKMFKKNVLKLNSSPSVFFFFKFVASFLCYMFPETQCFFITLHVFFSVSVDHVDQDI